MSSQKIDWRGRPFAQKARLERAKGDKTVA
jgi:hypothetical protein